MSELTPVRRIIRKLKEDGVDEDDIYVNPDSVHVVPPDDDDGDWED